MTNARTLLALTAASAAVLTPALAMSADAAAPAPKLLQAELVTAPELHTGTVAIVFRADHRLARGSNGGTLKGRAGLTGGRGNASIGSVKGPKGHACYVGYLDGRHLRVGHRYAAVITIGSTDHRRTLTLKKPKRVADFGADLNC